MHYDEDEWTKDGRNILSPERLSAIEQVIEKVGPVIVEHWFYGLGASPERRVFEDFEELMEYLKGASEGDAFHIWSFADVCKDDNSITNGKYPDSEGRVPKRGAY
jgi:hypothetical protein